MQTNILIVDDHTSTAELLESAIKSRISVILGDLKIFHASNFAEAMQIIKRFPIDIALVDIDLGEEKNGKDFLRILSAQFTTTIPIMITGHDDDASIKECFNLGAKDYIVKPVNAKVLLPKLEVAKLNSKITHYGKTITAQKSKTSALTQLDSLPSASMRELSKQLKKLKGADLSVLILGESGVGKEIVAQAIWELENDPTRPFITVNCSHLKGDLARSELFGHKKGAFTGANEDRIGLFGFADGGDIFLDEIHALPLDTQAMLLRTLNSGEVSPVGSSETTQYRFRVIAASNQNLKQLALEDRFQPDLYFRLRQYMLAVPALKDRKEDIAYLSKKCLESFVIDGATKSLSKEAEDFCQKQSFANGNIRLLFSALKSCALKSDDQEISLQHLQHELTGEDSFNSQHKTRPTLPSLEYFAEDYQLKMENLEQTLLNQAMERFGSLQSAATYLGLAKSTLASKLKKNKSLI